VFALTAASTPALRSYPFRAPCRTTSGCTRHSWDLTAVRGSSTGRRLRYGGTASQFTGDGIMAVFGAPVALEDHAIRACLAALGIQEEAKRLAIDVHDRDGVELQLRIGLNSGQVIAGEIGSGAWGYTTIGEQVGMAQRMEAAAPPGGVLCSQSTARLVERATHLGPVEVVTVKGSEEPVPAQRLYAVQSAQFVIARDEGPMLGRDADLSELVDAFSGALT
jgi:adenylate cyclase